MSRQRNDKYDAYIREQFCLGRTINEVYRSVNKDVRQQGLKDVLSYMTVKSRYDEWTREGKPGLLTLVEQKVLENGDVVMIYRDKDNNKWTTNR